MWWHPQSDVSEDEALPACRKTASVRRILATGWRLGPFGISGSWSPSTHDRILDKSSDRIKPPEHARTRRNSPTIVQRQ